MEVDRSPVYKSAYYVGGYPPATEGVCTDVVWRAFKEAGYDLKKMIDADIAAKRNADGLPYLLHNNGPVATEAGRFMFWYEKGIIGHFRYPAK